QNSATSDYHALQTKFLRRFSRGMEVQGSYTYAHSIDIASTDAFANYLNTPVTVGSPGLDRGNSDFDIRHSFTAGASYSVPTLRSHGAWREILGGWSVNAFELARSSPPVDIVGGVVSGTGTALRFRPNWTAGAPVELSGSGYPGGKVFNKAALTAAAVGSQ